MRRGAILILESSNPWGEVVFTPHMEEISIFGGVIMVTKEWESQSESNQMLYYKISFFLRKMKSNLRDSHSKKIPFLLFHH